MKLLFTFLILLLMGFSGKAQQNDTIVIGKSFIAFAGETYIDSIRVNSGKYFIDPDNVKEVRMFKANLQEHYKDGAVLITRKKQAQLVPLENFKNIEDKKNIYSKNIKIVVDGNLIEEPAGYVIEQSAITSVDIVNSTTSHDPVSTVVLITTKLKGAKK